jgi:hypothetical protein
VTAADWWQQAACRDADPDLFAYDPTTDPPATAEAAKLQRLDLAALVQPGYRLDDAFPIQPLEALALFGQLGGQLRQQHQVGRAPVRVLGDQRGQAAPVRLGHPRVGQGAGVDDQRPPLPANGWAEVGVHAEQ